uniref:Multidrug resistance outer membrane protein mdtP n=2 Tax=root TaxID=1 RepID=M1KES7_9BACT|nr:putative multidrug resistance outer membrane protein mdtP precursor [uncultured prokaryote]AGF34115.1 Multidrug resistance outer membrane protein mdtP precursor [uncultured bacterium DX-7F-24]
MKHFRIACGLLAAGALSTGCVAPVPKPPQPITSLHVGTTGGSGNPVTPGWWRQFADPQLDRLVAAALADSPGLAEARARVMAANADVSRVDALLYPHAQAGATVIHGHNSYNGNLYIYNGKTYSLGVIDPLQVDYHLDIWGEDRERIAVAEADAQVIRARQAQTELLLTAAVIKTYFAWQTANHLVAEQEALVELAEDARRILATAVRAGVQSPAAEVTQRAACDQARARLTELAQRRAALRYALLALLGKAASATLPGTRADLPAPKTFPLPATIDLDALAARPDIQIALWQAQAARHRKKLAKIAYYPDIHLTAFAGLTSLGLAKMFYSSSEGFAVAPAIRLPLFEGGALDANLHARAAAYDATIHAYDKTVLDAAAQVATDLAELDNSKRNFADDADAREEADRLTAIADTAYRSGVLPRLVRVRAQIRQHGADMALQNGTLRWLTAITDTATDLGGGAQPSAQPLSDPR